MERKLFSKGVLVIIVLSLLLANCKQQTHVTPSFLKPAFDGLDIDYNRFVVEAENGGTIKIDGGTTIVVPPNAFSDANGKLITGSVEIMYREFHDAADIVISGAPMAYDSAGFTYHFETAGMFEINGFQNSNPVYVADDKQIQINYATNTDGDYFNFYTWDEDRQNWVFMSGNNQPQTNPERDSLNQLVVEKPEKPLIPEILTKGAAVIDLDINYSLYPEFRAIEGLMWVYSGNDPSNDPQNNRWIYDMKWQNIEFSLVNEDKNQYQMHLQTMSNSFKTIVSPVLSESNYERSREKFNDQMAMYNQRKSEYEETQRIINMERSFIRSFSISGFGLFNWDYIYSSPTALAMNADIRIDGKKLDFEQTSTVFHITGQDRVVMRYNKHNINFFTLDPLDKNVIFVVLADNKIALINDENIRRMQLDQYLGYREQGKKVDVVLDLVTQNNRIETKDDLQKFISSL